MSKKIYVIIGSHYFPIFLARALVFRAGAVKTGLGVVYC